MGKSSPSLVSLQSTHLPPPASGQFSAVEQPAEEEAGGGGAGSEASLNLCHVCKSSTSQRCARCSSIFYCSQECQALHWRHHKNLCAKLVKIKTE
ncbi:hypothetical protein B484DRAFT_324238, partial [Ochromonadaceae sp. CCMP2298]